MECRKKNVLKFHRECVLVSQYRFKHGNETDLRITLTIKPITYSCIAEPLSLILSMAKY
jgi:hypothetical protein